MTRLLRTETLWVNGSPLGGGTLIWNGSPLEFDAVYRRLLLLHPARSALQEAFRVRRARPLSLMPSLELAASFKVMQSTDLGHTLGESLHELGTFYEFGS